MSAPTGSRTPALAHSALFAFRKRKAPPACIRQRGRVNHRSSDIVRPARPQHRGFTLLEMVVVVGLIALFAVILWAGGNNVDDVTLDRAAAEVKAALEYSRSEAQRTGTHHGLTMKTSNQKITAYRLNTDATPFRDYTVYHPLDKKLLALEFGVTPRLEGVTLDAVSLSFCCGGLLAKDHLGFDGQGRPEFNDGTFRYGLNSAAITLSYRGQSRTISVNPNTGRVQVSP